MKNKKILSLLLVATMCFSLLVGCGKKEPEVKVIPADEMKALITEMGEVKEGQVLIDANFTIYKDTLEKLSETEETENEEVMFEMEPTEALENLVDENGNLNINMSFDAKYNDANQVDMNIEIFEEKMNAIVDDKDVYIEIDGLFEILEEAIGDEVALIRMFLGDEAEYIKTTTENEEDETTTEKTEMPDVKEYITAENTVKNEDGSYLAKLGNKYVQDSLTDELKEKLGVDTVSNSIADFSILKDSANNKYVSKISLNFENMITCEVAIDLASQDVTIELPAAEKVLDTNEDGNISLDFGMNEASDLEVETNEGVDFEWISEPTDDEYSWEDFESVEIDYDFTSASEYAFDFVVESANFEGDAVAERYNIVKAQIDDTLAKISPTMNYNISSSSDKNWNSYSANYEGDFEKFDEEISLHLSDNYVDLEINYYFGKDYDNETLNAVAKRIEETTGLIVPTSELDTWIQNLLSQYKEEYWSMSAYAKYDELSFDIYIWDGNEINISVKRSNLNY